MQASQILNSWKEVASYMGRGVRTVQRWHDALYLPVHRIKPGNRRSPVFAYRGELNRWMQRHTRQDIAARVEEQLVANKESREKLLAIQKKLQSWRTASQRHKTLEDRFEQNRQNRFTFMSIDLDTALTLAKIAEHASDERKRTRNEVNARHALDTILHLYHPSESTEDEREFLDQKIAELRTALERLSSRAVT